MTEFKHVTVLLNEAVAGLNVHPDGTYVDATLGGGGHSSAILNQLTTGRLYSFDQDQTAIKYNQQHLKKFINDGRSILIEDNFRNLETALSNMIWEYHHHNSMMRNGALAISWMRH